MVVTAAAAVLAVVVDDDDVGGRAAIASVGENRRRTEPLTRDVDVDDAMANAVDASRDGARVIHDVRGSPVRGATTPPTLINGDDP